jgi:hypothetical protein
MVDPLSDNTPIPLLRRSAKGLIFSHFRNTLLVAMQQESSTRKL